MSTESKNVSGYENLSGYTESGEFKWVEERKNYKIDYNKVKSVEDVILILRRVDLQFSFDSSCKLFDEMIERGFLIEQK